MDTRTRLYIAGALAAGGAVIACLARPRHPPCFSQGVTHTIHLSNQDRTLAKIPCPTISTVTIYRGTPPKEELKQRVLKILEGNPWLTARFVSRDGVPVLEYSSEADHSRHFEVCDSIELAPDSPYHETQRLLRPWAVPDTGASFGQDIPLFKVVLMTKGVHFGVFVSMNHILGDGYTFYKIHGMLSADAEVSAMNPARMDSTQHMQLMHNTFGVAETNFIDNPSWGFIAGWICAVLFRTPEEAKVVYFDPEWVGAEKAKAAAEGKVEFVSTNDVITSDFLRKMNPNFGGMAVNCRNRIPELTDDLAGNYETVMTYREGDFESPCLIRKSLQRCVRVGDSPMPSNLELLKFDWGVATNWGTFYADVVLDNCSQKIHLPIREVDSMKVMVIFCPRKGVWAAQVSPGYVCG